MRSSSDADTSQSTRRSHGRSFLTLLAPNPLIGLTTNLWTERGLGETKVPWQALSALAKTTTNVELSWRFTTDLITLGRFHHEQFVSDYVSCWWIKLKETRMVTHTFNQFTVRPWALSGLILLVVQLGCSLPSSKPVSTYPGNSVYSPYQTNYPPAAQFPSAAQFQSYPPTNVAPNQANGQWNQSGQLRWFNPMGFAGTSC